MPYHRLNQKQLLFFMVVLIFLIIINFGIVRVFARPHTKYTAISLFQEAISACKDQIVDKQPFYFSVFV